MCPAEGTGAGSGGETIPAGFSNDGTDTGVQEKRRRSGVRRCTAFLYCGLAALSYVISCLHGSTGHIILCGIIRVFAYMHICRGGKQLHGERESGMTGQGWGFCGCVCGSCKGLGLGCPVRGLYFGVWQWGGKTAKQSVGQCNCSPRVKYARYCGVLTGQGGEPPRILSRNILTKAPFFSYSG